jgi:hypothetical protein
MSKIRIDALTEFNAVVRDELLHEEDGSCAPWMSAHALTCAFAKVNVAEFGPIGFIIAHVGAGKSTYIETHPDERDVVDVDIAFHGSELWSDTKKLMRLGEWQRVRSLQLIMIKQACPKFARRIVMVQNRDIMELVLRAFGLRVGDVPYAYVTVPVTKMTERVSCLGTTRSALWVDNAQENSWDASTDCKREYKSVERALRHERHTFYEQFSARCNAALNSAGDMIDVWLGVLELDRSGEEFVRYSSRTQEVPVADESEESEGEQQTEEDYGSEEDEQYHGIDDLSDEEMTTDWLLHREEQERFSEERGECEDE